jgi:hypothetical protein
MIAAMTNLSDFIELSLNKTAGMDRLGMKTL